MQAVEAANQSQKHVLGNKINARFGTNLKGKRIAVWGLAFKPNTDDMREAASVELINSLLDQGVQVTAYDPAAMEEARRVFVGKAGLDFAESPIAALENADALAIVTEWKEFRSPDFTVVRSKLKEGVIFDGRNLYEPEEVRRHGLEYFPIGRQ
jgi:UDPglucose 6-dehydrogenase